MNTILPALTIISMFVTLGILLFGVTLDQFGGASQLAAWAVSFATCGVACLAGAAATVFMPRNI